MKRKKKDGIFFENTIYLTEENQKSFPLYMRLFQLLAVYCSSYCFIDVIIQTFNINVIKSQLFWGIFTCGCIFFVSFIFPAYDLIKIIIAGLIYGGLFYRMFSYIQNGFYLLENAIIAKASKYYGFQAFRFVADHTAEGRDLTILIIFIIVPVTVLIAYSMLRGRLIWLSYAVMIIPVVASFAVGATPSEFLLTAYILIFLFLNVSYGLLRVADYSHSKSGEFQKGMLRRIGIKSALVLCIMLFILFSALKLIVPVEKYESYNASTIKETKMKIQNKMMSFSIDDVSEKLSGKLNINSNRLTSSGGLSNGELGRVDQVVYDNSEHLFVKAPMSSISEGIYMIGYVGSVYTGDSWEDHTQEINDRYERLKKEFDWEGYDPAAGSTVFLNLYPNSFVFDRGKIEVTYLKADSRYTYAPYFSIFSVNNNVRYDRDLMIMNNANLKAQTYEYYYNVFEGINNKLKNLFDMALEGADIDSQLAEYKIKYLLNEKKYRDFVYETYTRLPEGLDRLKNEFSKEAVGEYANNLIDAISYIKKYLYDNTRYTLAPGRLPKDRDFVEYFLFENKLGYCIHYASAGVLILRAMGYPARYVEGYAINRSDLSNSSSIYLGETDRDDSIAEIFVKDHDAHAWAEVYIDGFGWIPVEFTVGSGMNDMVDLINNGLDRSEANENNTPSPTKAPVSPSPKPTEVPKEEEEPINSALDTKNGNELSNKSTGKTVDATGNIRWLLVIIPVLILLTVIMTYILRRAKGRDVYENYSQRALGIYEKIEKLFIIGRLLPKKARSLEENEDYIKEHFAPPFVLEFNECMEIVKKARFGKETIRIDEYLTVQNYYKNLYDMVYNSRPGIKKLFIKFKIF